MGTDITILEFLTITGLTVIAGMLSIYVYAFFKAVYEIWIEKLSDLD
jgi:hypothetical protein